MMVLRTSESTLRVTAPNPGPYTLEGTNSYVIGTGDGDGDGDGVIVVDPGPDDADHLRRLAGFGPVRMVLITHRHADHTGGIDRFHALTGAPVRAADPAFCRDGDVLRDWEELDVAGIRIRALASPGHTADSFCFQLPDDGPDGSVLTGDTILGRGTTVISPPDGDLGDYLASVTALGALGRAITLPGHGPVLPDLAAVCAQYLEHRHRRLDEVRAAIATLGDGATAAEVAAVVYPRIESSLRQAAEHSVAAQLAYLRTRS